MPLRTRLFIILSVIIAIILAISVLLLLNKRSKTKKAEMASSTAQSDLNQVDRVPVQSITDVSSIISNGTITVAQQTTEEIQKNTAKQISKVFAERYGSFSTQNSYQNILEIKDLVTTDLYSSLSQIMNTAQNQTTYYGMTTKVIAMNITKWASDSATITLSATREETKSSTTKKTNQDAVVQMTKSGSNWLVSSFKWD